jgi:hypothetical protein
MPPEQERRRTERTQERREINAGVLNPAVFALPSISSKSAEPSRIKYLIKSAHYKFCTKSAKSGRFGEKRPERKNFGPPLLRRSPEVYVRRPVFIGIFARLKGDREFWTRTRWRRDLDSNQD